MGAQMSDGRVTLNAEGKRYAASFRIEHGEITVTSGSLAKVVEVGEVVNPKSIARTVLRTMVRDGPAAAALTELNAKLGDERPGHTTPRKRRSALRRRRISASVAAG